MPSAHASAFMCSLTAQGLFRLRPLVCIPSELNMVEFDTVPFRTTFEHPLPTFSFEGLARKTLLFSIASSLMSRETPGLRELNWIAKEIIDTPDCHNTLLPRTYLRLRRNRYRNHFHSQYSTPPLSVIASRHRGQPPFVPPNNCCGIRTTIQSQQCIYTLSSLPLQNRFIPCSPAKLIDKKAPRGFTEPHKAMSRSAPGRISAQPQNRGVQDDVQDPMGQDDRPQ